MDVLGGEIRSLIFEGRSIQKKSLPLVFRLWEFIFASQNSRQFGKNMNILPGCSAGYFEGAYRTWPSWSDQLIFAYFTFCFMQVGSQEAGPSAKLDWSTSLGTPPHSYIQMLFSRAHFLRISLYYHFTEISLPLLTRNGIGDHYCNTLKIS